MKVAFISEKQPRENKNVCDGKCVNFDTCFNCLKYIKYFSIIAYNKDGTYREKKAKKINLSSTKFNQHKITHFFKKQ
tara:strand:+ start:723 stop:953 length:231 start_codon:yes stop_codon:yes gene_type:complete